MTPSATDTHLLSLVRRCQPCPWMRGMLIAWGIIGAFAAVAVPVTVTVVTREHTEARTLATRAENLAQANHADIRALQTDIRYLVRAMERMSGMPRTDPAP